MRLTYWSHSCFRIETARHRVVIDPFLTHNPLAPVKASQVKCDAILITHGHNDHIGDAAAIAKQNNALVVSNYEIATFLAGQGASTVGMNIGGARQFEFGRVKWTIAHHGSAYQTNDGTFLYMGNPMGLLFMAEGKTIYHAGDTGLFLDMKLIGELHPIDVALLPIGDHFTMGIDDAVKAVEFLRPKAVIPMHYKTFEPINVDPAEFASRSTVPVTILQPGESFDVS